MSEAVTVVTGASGGIGEELAYCAAKAGRKVVLVARSADKLAAVAAKIEAAGGKQAVAIAADLSDRQAGNALAAALKERDFKVAELVNNAGYGLTGRIEKLDAADQLGIVDLNCRTLTDLTLRFLPEIIAAKGGVLNVASTAAFQPGPNMAVYYASKAYVLSFSEAIWFELRGRARVTALCPGPVPTGFAARATKGETIGLMKLSMTDAGYVAETGWRAFERGKRVVIPGLLNKFAAFGTRFAPKSLLLGIAARFSRAERQP
ncbi:MAG: SDR family oxidoreductase [Xanthobacteraceae bacterium]|nr:SDR family oxidoreductase [Xanthobacteraceae bacterium]QYK44937.1 MAG: SDR family oxidoreductase [Xanthobacteraceae bacterium]